MKITAKWLKSKNACTSDSENQRAEKEFNGDIFKIIPYLISENRLDYANWLITQYMNKKQNVQYSIFAAEQVIDIFEKKYPNDNRPRKAIEAAKKYLKTPCEKTKQAADTAANDAYAAADKHFAANDAYAAAAAYAADAAAYADTTISAAYAADAAAYADIALIAKIIKNGSNILKGGDKND